jgi:GNAT superfamily N-acetyltransferase
VINVWPVANDDAGGVKRGRRGRGVPRALKTMQIGWAKANGFEELHARKDQRNAPIRRLNAEFGYRRGIRRIHLPGPTAPE